MLKLDFDYRRKYPHFKNFEYVNMWRRLLVEKSIEGEIGNSLES